MRAFAHHFIQYVRELTYSRMLMKTTAYLRTRREPA